MTTALAAELRPGTKYLVKHRLPTERYTRQSCVTFLGGTTYSDELRFDARPAGGTQTFFPQWIESVTKAPQGSTHYMNRRA